MKDFSQLQLPPEQFQLNSIEKVYGEDLISLIKIDDNKIEIDEKIQFYLFYFYYRELLIPIINNNFKNKIENINKSFLINQKEYVDIFFDLLENIVLKNVIKLIKEYEEYKIFQGYNEIISVLIYNIKEEDFNFEQLSNNKILSKKNIKNIKKINKKINKIIINKINSKILS